MSYGPPRIAEPWDLTEEDFLPERPRFDSLPLEIDPPNWAVGAISKQGGRRHSKREVQLGSASGAYSPSMGHIVPWRPPEGPKNSPDAQLAYDRAMAKRRAKQAKRSEAQVSARKAVPAGNLSEDDYRFWKGFPLMNSDKELATCRWCGLICNGRNRMLRHHVEAYCKEHLLALYRFAHKQSKQRYCFACRTQTSERRWGFPLCNKITCIGRWKFTDVKKLGGFGQYRLWAEEAQFKDPAGGPFSQLPPEAYDPKSDTDDIIGAPC
jgi:hypothetical protein